MSEVLGRPVEYVPESEEDAFSRLHRAGRPGWLIGARLALAEYQRQGGGTGIITDAVEEITGRPPRAFRDFAEAFAESFRSKSQ